MLMYNALDGQQEHGFEIENYGMLIDMFHLIPLGMCQHLILAVVFCTQKL